MLSIGKQLTAEQRVSKAVYDIISNPKYVALAGVVMVGDRTVSDTIPTACTNGRDEMYGRAFVDSLNDAELRFLILHEVYHKLYKHLTTWEWMYKQEANLANMACDHVINIKISDDNTDGWAVMPAQGCRDYKYRGWDAARVFKDLRENNTSDDRNADGDSTTGSHNAAVGHGFDEHDWEGAQELTDDEKRELARDIDEAIRQGAMVAGKIGDGSERDRFGDLLEPQVNWREALREFIQTTCAGSDYSTWSRPNRRYVSSGYYMPSGVNDQIGELVVAIDTSGSIGQRELTLFMSEIHQICRTLSPERVRVLYWDTRVRGNETYDMHELDDLPKATKPVGGGGTNVECVPNFMRDESIKPQACVVLTDGYVWGSWGQWDCPVLWCILDNKQAKPDTGKQVNIQSEEM
jgi:predicted metal-dependent peptidase